LRAHDERQSPLQGSAEYGELNPGVNRRTFLAHATTLAASAALYGCAISNPNNQKPAESSQRLSLAKLREWESWRCGMFIHFGMSTFRGDLPDASPPASTYNPDRLDVDSWVQLARDAGMKYAVLTAKHVAGHCLWPSAHTDYTVASSGNKT